MLIQLIYSNSQIVNKFFCNTNVFFRINCGTLNKWCWTILLGEEIILWWKLKIAHKCMETDKVKTLNKNNSHFIPNSVSAPNVLCRPNWCYTCVEQKLGLMTIGILPLSHTQISGWLVSTNVHLMPLNPSSKGEWTALIQVLFADSWLAKGWAQQGCLQRNNVSQNWFLNDIIH